VKAVTDTWYPEYGTRPETTNSVSVVVRREGTACADSLRTVSWYSVMTPLWCSGGGGLQVRVKLVEVVWRTASSVGAPEGAGRKITIRGGEEDR
jgi:hypothetical protein